ncbi:MAG: hypothetical protein IT204_10350 [Fimbriimonadaceae bacterium]|nr:hypothetical protein [Fimbriimonadaceae bacterium]
MSYDIGIRTLRLEPTPRLAHVEYCSNYALARAVTGRDPRTDSGAMTAFEEAWDYDFIWTVNDGPVGWHARGRVTDMGHAEFLEDGVDRREAAPCPFVDIDDVLEFDAVEEYGLPNMDELVDYYERWYTTSQAARPHQVWPGGYYKSIVSGAIQTFGWEMLLLGASQPDRFTKVLDGFFRLTLHHMQAWAKTSVEVIIQHDDMVWTQGPFMHPDFYREVIFPRYAKLWEPLHEAGKIVLYCSDGTFTEFIDDIYAAGADGLIFEPTTSLDYCVEKYGQTKAIVGSHVDCRTLTFGTREDIRVEMDRSLAVVKDCPGFIWAVGNHIPSNVPVDNALFYIDYLREHWQR